MASCAVYKDLIAKGRINLVPKRARLPLAAAYKTFDSYNATLNLASNDYQQTVTSVISRVRTRERAEAWRLQRISGHVADLGGSSYTLRSYVQELSVPKIPSDNEYLFFCASYAGWDSKITREDLSLLGWTEQYVVGKVGEVLHAAPWFQELLKKVRAASEALPKLEEVLRSLAGLV